MNAADWTAANQQLLGAEFRRLKQRLAGDPDTDAGAEVATLRAAMHEQPPAIDMLAHRFGLSVFETDIVLLAAGAEMDSQLAALCASAGGQPARPWASFAIALAVLRDPHWSALSPWRPLRHWRLIDVDESALLSSARLRLDERVLHFLAGIDGADPRLAPLLQPVAPVVHMAAGQQALAERIAQALDRSGAPMLVQLCGDDSAGRESVAAAAAALLGRELQALVDPQVLPPAAADVALLATLCEREALLGRQALFINLGADPPGAALRQFIERVGGPVFVSAEPALALRRPALLHRVDLPPAAEQRALWLAALGEGTPVTAAELDAVVSQFSFSGRRIAATAAPLAGRGPLVAGALWQACRGAAPAQLSRLAQRVEPRAGWHDLVLPAAPKQQLQQIVVHMQRRFEVHSQWGFGDKLSRGLGISALFAGDSGTGKTMAVEVLAATLELELYRIDLSAVVSKYIGETEKNLRQVFDAAEDSGAILLFDEADALFGKRSEVRDSHDRYANIEVSYLLQRMESYRGLAILTTNHKAALDPAFTRRLRFVLQFPFPETAEREAIWQRAFPAATPRRGLDYARLARLQAAGGHIQNIALAAAFSAAQAGEPVTMSHLLQAAHADARKRERPIADSETRGWA